MPQCIIEYSDSIEEQVAPETLMHTVTQAVSASPLFNSMSVMTRLMNYDTYCFGKDKSNFIHITIKLFKGRSDKEKADLCYSVVLSLESFGIKDSMITCECAEMHEPSYYEATV